MKTRINSAVVWSVAVAAAIVPAVCAAPSGKRAEADAQLAAYFRAETAMLGSQCLADIETRQDWDALAPEYRRQHAEMLGLDPLPPRSDLKPVITGRIERDDFVVENLHFQSMPGLYVTANLYLPKALSKPAPAVLYVCGHGPVITNGVSYGNKVSYQHHGIWFARHGYVCLVIDTVQLGEIQGQHHGTYREGQWWWNSRGYTPAGVEAWNGIRALDYLGSRPEVDTNRFGITGRSGGGAYSWTIAALDARVKVVAPVAGITDLRNHVIDGAVEGHCDCMYFVNTYRWDYPLQAALIAPRPLLLVNTDADTIFPLDGVQRVHSGLRHLYRLHNASNNLGLVLGPGPHKDTQDLQVPVFRWFNRHLKGEDPLIADAAVKLLTPQELKVFTTLPADAINTNIQASFVREAPAAKLPSSEAEWQRMRADWLGLLRAECFAGWPAEGGPLGLQRAFRVEDNGLRHEAYDFLSQTNVTLRLYLARGVVSSPRRVALNVTTQFSPALSTMADPSALSPLDEARAALGAIEVGELSGGTVKAAFLPRGCGINAWSGDARKQTQLRRRFMLLGQTLDGMRVWDTRRALQALRSLKELEGTALEIHAAGDSAVNALFATLFEPEVAALHLNTLPRSLVAGPDYLNVLKILDLPQAVALAAERTPTRLLSCELGLAEYPLSIARELRWAERQIRVVTP